MEFTLEFYIMLLILSPWPIWTSLMFYYRYKFDTNFEYFITKPKQLHKLWATIMILPLICSSIFLLRYNRMGITVDLYKWNLMLEQIVNTLGYLDVCILGLFILLFIITWILSLRLLYQHFRKCLLALYLYYYQFKKIESLYEIILLFRVDYRLYLWRRVRIFISSDSAFFLSEFIWPFSIEVVERNLFSFILPYLIVFDCLIQQGQLTKIFIILPWYYIYSLLRFGLKFFFAIHKLENWQVAEEMYGYPR